MPKEIVEFNIRLTDGQIHRNMRLANVSPERAIAILMQASETFAREIHEQAELQLTKHEMGNN